MKPLWKMACVLSVSMLLTARAEDASPAYNKVLEIAAAFPGQSEKEQVAAIAQLATHGKVAISELQRIYEQRGYGAAVREACERAFLNLGQEGEAAARASLRRLAQEGGFEEMQARGLERLARESQIKALRETLRAPDLLLRYIAVRAIKNLGAEELKGALTESRADARNKLIRSNIDAALESFKK